MTTHFISTAIPYVNAEPHVGFAYELVLADILARHARRRGRDVRFVTGTDDNSLKNVRAASCEGLAPQAFVDRNAAAFRALAGQLDLAPDDFVRTSRDPRHRTAVEWLWRACAANGDLYRRVWTGRYCGGCEAFVDDAVEQCAEHAAPLQVVHEDNWFFRLSRWREPLIDAISSGRLAILPDSARAETLAFLAGEVRDLSVSRDAARADSWGIPVPGDPAQVVYVWFDALANYLASLGLGGDDDALLDRYWRSGGAREHVIGKGITRFHAVYWAAFLLSAGLPLPDRILVHGYLTVEGRKIGKSNGGFAVGPLTSTCGIDGVRWYFARRCRTRVDSDVAAAEAREAHDRDLVDRLGNLVQRCITLAGSLTGHRVPPRGDGGELAALAEALPARIDAALAAFVPDEACAAIVAVLDAANRTLDASAPWRTRHADPAGAAAALYAPLEAARIVAGELAPIVPGTARTIAERLGDPDLSPTWGGLVPGAELRSGPPPLARRRQQAG
jgi:methionyl-tRNA synthetase